MAKQVIRPQLYFLEPGLGVDGENGRLLTGAEGAANRLPFPVTRGTVIAPAAPQPYAVFFYRPAIPPELIHTYSYQAESNWTTYAPEFSRTELRDDAWEATETGFIRIFVVPAPAEDGETAAGEIAAVRRKTFSRPFSGSSRGLWRRAAFRPGWPGRLTPCAAGGKNAAGKGM